MTKEQWLQATSEDKVTALSSATAELLELLHTPGDAKTHKVVTRKRELSEFLKNVAGWETELELISKNEPSARIT